jgi:threonine dehydrogenase-like Zn-dependent dehydrogenase
MSTETAQALWFVAQQEAAILEEEIDLEPGPEEIIVRARHSLISAGTELNVYRGQIETAEELTRLPSTTGTFPFPIKYAYQVVGDVVAAGTESGFRPGEVVFAQHPHQTLFKVHRDWAYPVPDGLSTRKAAFANLYCVALTALLDVPVRMGDVVVVSGAGVVGTMAASIARRTAGTLILVEPTVRGEKAALLCQPDVVVTPDEAVQAVNELSQGRGADVWIEASGSPAALQTALGGTGLEGNIVVLSYYGNKAVTLTLAPEFHFRRQRITSSFVGYLGSGLQPRWDRKRRMQVGLAGVGQLDVEALITHERPFSEAPSCFRLLDERPTETLAVMLDYDR